MTIEMLTLADRSLAYQRQVGNKNAPGIFFLGGFASDMEGSKASFLADHCAKASLSYMRFDYRGCGSSPGNFADGTIGAWLEDTLVVFDQLTEGTQIVVGSSMGGWLGLLLAKARPERMRAYIGIAAAPDFTEELIWKNLTTQQRETLMHDGAIFEEGAPPDRRVPITLKLIEEARKHLIFQNPLPLSCPVRLLQGLKDKEVPWGYAPRISAHIDQNDVRVTLIKNGDHRLSTTKDLELLGQTVAEFI